MVNVKYFGMLTDVTRCSEEKLALDSDQLADLLQTLEDKYQISRFPIKIAVNNEIVANNATIKDSDEIAILPPYAGG